MSVVAIDTVDGVVTFSRQGVCEMAIESMGISKMTLSGKLLVLMQIAHDFEQLLGVSSIAFFDKDIEVTIQSPF